MWFSPSPHCLEIYLSSLLFGKLYLFIHHRNFCFSASCTDLFVGPLSRPLFITYLATISNENWSICGITESLVHISSGILCGAMNTLTAISVDRLLALLLRLRWFLRNKSYRLIFLKPALSECSLPSTDSKKYNKNDRSPFSFKRCDGPILPRSRVPVVVLMTRVIHRS